MLDHGQDDTVRAIRRVMETEMVEPLSEMVAKITGRQVIACQSQIMFAPDRVIAVYIFNDTITALTGRGDASGPAARCARPW